MTGDGPSNTRLGKIYIENVWMLGMELRHLRYFVAVAEHLSFTGAAESLGVSQPPLSQQIRDLELEVGADLFERTSRRVALTPAGADFLDRSRVILAQASEAGDRARAIGSGNIGVINIGLTGSVLTGPIGELTYHFRRRYADVDVRFHEMPPDGQIEALKNRQIDLSFQRSPPDDPVLVHEIAWRERVGVVMPRDHPLDHGGPVALKDLRGHPYISLRLKDSRFANDIWNACVAAGFVPDLAQQVGEATSLTSLAAAGVGVAVIPEFASMLRHPNVAFRVLEPPVPAADVHAIRLTRAGPLVENFLEFVRSEAASIASRFRSQMEAIDARRPAEASPA